MPCQLPRWRCPRIDGELLKLGIAIGQTSVAKYMTRGRRGAPSQGWRTFLRNHADGIAAMDLFVVPKVSFRLLYGLLILRHQRRRLLWVGGTMAHPTAEWIARQLTEACGWDEAPRYLIRDRDRSYGAYLSDVFAPWASAIDRHPRGRRGKTDMRSGRSGRSGGNALTT